MCLALVIAMLSTSTPAAPPIISAVAREQIQGTVFWLSSSGMADSFARLLLGRRGAPAPATPESAVPTVSRVQIFPGNVTLVVGDHAILAAVGYDDNNEPVNGISFTWQCEDTARSLGTQSLPDGDFKALYPSTFKVMAEGNGQSSTVTVTVLPGKNEDSQLANPQKRTRNVSTRDLPTQIVAPQSATDTLSANQNSGASATSLLPGEGGWDDSNYYSAMDPGNEVGKVPGRSQDDGAGSGNFQLTAPVLTLPGRGINLALGLSYNSLLWNKAGSQLTFDIDRGWPAPGWSLGFGKILGMGVNNGSMMIESDGTRHAYSGTITYDPNGDYTNFLGHTTDGTFIDYGHHTGLGGAITNAWAKLQNGTVIDYTALGDAAVYPTRITDATGNYITITYRNNQGPAIETVTDTLGRVITFNYDTQNRLTSITAPKLQTGTRTLVRLHYKAQDLSALGSNYGFSTTRTTVVRNSAPWVLDAIYYPATGTGYWFGDTDSYSPYGMIAKVPEERGMSWTSGTGNEQGTVSAGTMTQQSVYNYPAQANPALTDAPTYSTKTESWANIDTAPAVTTYEAHQNSTPRSVKITQPDGTWTEQLSYNYSTLAATDPNKFKDGLIYQDETHDAGGAILAKTTSTWEQGAYESPRPLRHEAIDERNQTTAVVFGYGSNYNQVTSVEDYDFGGTVSRQKTVTDYENGTNYTNRHIFSLVKKVQVFAADGVTRVSQTDYQYDGATLADTPGVIMYNQSYNPGTTQTTNCLPCLTWEHLDDGRIYCVEYTRCSIYNPETAYRGNVTQVKTYSDAVNLTGAVTEEKRYDITGNLITASTSCCEQTSFDFTPLTTTEPQVYAYARTKTRGSADPNSPARVSTSIVYDFKTGLILSATDSSNRTSTTTYDPDSLRPLADTSSTGAYVSYVYDDTAMTVSETSKTADNVIAAQSVKYLNGLGDVRRVETLGANNTWDVVETKYTQLGQIWKQTLPYRVGQDQPQWTESFYDAQGRVWKIHAPDNSELLSYYNETSRPGAASSIPGHTLRIKDAWGKERWERSDASGRLVEVVEPNPGGSGSVFEAGALVTTYQYDISGHLTQANQGSQVRKFAYDALGRLTRQKLSEQSATLDTTGQFVGPGNAGAQWSEAFAYDQRSNLISHTDARGVKTLFSYQVSGVDDPLNRLQSVSYDLSGTLDTSSPIAATAPISYEYIPGGDVTSLLRVTTSGVSTEVYAYDGESRVSSQTLTLTSRPSFPMVTSYIYDSLDRITDIYYPAQYGVIGSPRKVVHHDYDVASRLSGLKVDGAIHASDINYNAASQTTSLKVGAGGANQITESYQFDALSGSLVNQKIQRAGTSLLDLSYDYLRAGTTSGQTGQLTKIINNLDRNKDKAYEYDALGRLTKVSGGVNTSWTQSYAYDRYGNRTGVTSNGVESLRTAQVAPEPKVPQPDLPTNQLAASRNQFEQIRAADAAQQIASNPPSSSSNPAGSETPAENKFEGRDDASKSTTPNNGSKDAPPVTAPSLFSTKHTPFDFDGDGKSDISAWRRATGVWTIKQSSNGVSITPQLGARGDQIVPGDYDGDGTTDVAIWQTTTGNWSIKQSSTGNVIQQQFGQAGDAPVAADYDGDGKTDIAVWRASTGYWYIVRSTDGTMWTLWGGSQFGDIAEPGDYDGDGKADVCVWRPSTGNWFIEQSSDGQPNYQMWGLAGDVPVPADYDGDHKTDLAVWRPSTGYWYVVKSSNGSYTATPLGAGTGNDITVPADYDGDGKADMAVWRPATGVWTIVQSIDGTTTTQTLGASGDVPVPSAYIRRSSAPKNQSSEIPRDGYASVSYDEQTNRVTLLTSGFTYDAAGNQTRIAATNGSGWQRMEYDAAGRLVKVKDDNGATLQSYVYGSSNQRLMTQDGDGSSNSRTYYIWNGDAVIAEYIETQSAPTAPQWSKSYIFLGARLLSTSTPNVSGGEVTQYHHPDRLGTRLISNAADTNVQEQATLPFGTALDSESTGASNRRFTSYDRSAVTGLDYAVNRTYDSQQGRFTQVDPIGIQAASLDNPQSLNLYNYVGNDPVNRTDPNGLFWGKLKSFFKKVGKIFTAVGTAIAKVLNNRWLQIGIFIVGFVVPFLGPGLAAVVKAIKLGLKIYDTISNIASTLQLYGALLEGKLREFGKAVGAGLVSAALSTIEDRVILGVKEAIKGNGISLKSILNGAKTGFLEGYRKLRHNLIGRGLQSLVPFYGNFCSPGNVDGNTTPAVDALDEVCKWHDKVYQHHLPGVTKFEADKVLFLALITNATKSHLTDRLVNIAFGTHIAGGDIFRSISLPGIGGLIGYRLVTGRGR
jgi:RHS repeat-associated protein